MSRVLYGTVVSDKADKTIVISTRVRRTHPLYKKQYTVTTKFMAHDAKNEAKVGDMVTIIETRPISSRKRFTLDKIVERGGVRFEEADATADVPSEELAPKPVEKTEDKPNAAKKPVKEARAAKKPKEESQ